MYRFLCFVFSMISLNALGQLNLQLSQTPTTCGLSDGTVSVQISGGVQPYDLFWEPSGSLNTIVNNIGSGWHVVAVFDSADSPNYSIDSIFVPALNPIVINVVDLQNASCFNAADGQISVALSGGVNPSVVSWNGVSNTTQNQNNLLPGIYTIQATDINGCVANTTLEITSPPAIIVDETIIPATCFDPNGSISLIASGGVGNLSVVWEPSLSGNYDISGPVGTYQVSISDQQICTFVQQYEIPLLNDLAVTVSPASALIDYASEIGLLAEIAPVVPGSVFSWSPNSGLSCNNCPDPFASPQETTTYVVTVNTPGGCVASAETTIAVNYPCGELFLPSVISPNGDGINDDFRLLGFCVEFAEILVFDRWGNLVFSTRDKNQSWDATVNGREVSGVFAYTASIVRTNGDFITLKGNVSIVR